VVFDKTGTLTQGKPTLQALVVSPKGAASGDEGAENQNLKDSHSHSQTQTQAPSHAEAQTEAQALSIAASLQAASEHPLARAVMQAAAAQNLVFAQATQVAAVPGMGLGASTETAGVGALGATGDLAVVLRSSTGAGARTGEEQALKRATVNAVKNRGR
jgi:cation transport ATPase